MIGTAIANAAQRLAAAGIDNPRLDARLLLAHILGISSSDLILSTTNIPPEALAKFESAIARRTNRESGPVIAEHIRRLMAQHEFDLGNGVFIRRTCSIGFASYPVLPREPWRFSWEDVVSLADQCLYAAKHNGRNSWVGVRPLNPAAGETSDLPLTANLDALVAEGYLRLQVSPSN